MISAKVVADSINESGNRITSLIVVIPRIVLAELNTHRALSKNSASSRAIPAKKMAKMVEENPFIPIAFQKDHKGMQGAEYFTEAEVKMNGIMEEWLGARDYALYRAKSLHEKGVTKQLCNRILEPFMYHTVLITATEWENFMALRNHQDAEIHIQAAAVKILEALNASTPSLLKIGEWHIPFGDKIDTGRLEDIIYKDIPDDFGYTHAPNSEFINLKLKISTARCARVSYLNFQGKDDYTKDIELHDILKNSGHWSPFEHCAMALNTPEQSGNFVGWKQYRKTFYGENRTDGRVQRQNEKR